MSAALVTSRFPRSRLARGCRSRIQSAALTGECQKLVRSYLIAEKDLAGRKKAWRPGGTGSRGLKVESTRLNSFDSHRARWQTCVRKTQSSDHQDTQGLTHGTSGRD